MKKKQLLVPECESKTAPHIRYTAVMPTHTFAETELFTVFPDLHAAYNMGHPQDKDSREKQAREEHHHDQHTSITPMIIITFQMSNFDFSNGAQDYVDRSRDSFLDFAKEIQRRLVPDGWWIDFSDPATGLPTLTQASSVLYNESDAVEQLLSLEHMYVNENHSLVHPIFGEKVYLASAVVYGGTADRLKELLVDL
eukprot:GILI01035736.1.p1 GENE.GILI01035736.1~~GILI01035736.1.p1  ORF type:complete len:196 (+),score=25.24 GILI01035736.1:36-623(+)